MFKMSMKVGHYPTAVSARKVTMRVGEDECKVPRPTTNQFYVQEQVQLCQDYPEHADMRDMSKRD